MKPIPLQIACELVNVSENAGRTFNVKILLPCFVACEAYRHQIRLHEVWIEDRL
jgi:hypothetical protein